MQVSDIHGWDEDPDLAQLPAWLNVTVEMMDVHFDLTVVGDINKAERYAEIYRQFGPWGLPPVVCVGDTGWQIAGAHRMYGAYLAKIKQIPTFIVHAHGDDR